MSFNSYSITPEMQQAMQQIADQRIASKSAQTTWYDPVRKQYFIANDPTSTKPDYGIAITKAGKLEGMDRSRYTRPAVIQQLTGAGIQSSTELDKSRFDIFTNELVDQAVMFYERMDRARNEYHNTGDEGRFLGAGTITAQDNAVVANVMVDQTVLDLVTRDFILLDAVTRRSWDKLVYTFDTRTPYLNTGGLGELDMSPPRAVKYARSSISLKKAQGHVSVSIWASMAIRDHDQAADSQSIIDADFERIFATDVASSLTGFTDNATAGAYDVIGSGAFHSTTNPALMFDEDSLTIKTAGGRADTLVMNTKAYRALIQNTFMRLSGNPTLALGVAMPPAGTIRATHQLLPGYTIFVDELATADNLLIYDKRSPVFIEGATSMRNIELNYGQIKDTVSDRWYGSGLRVQTWGIEETNIVT